MYTGHSFVKFCSVVHRHEREVEEKKGLVHTSLCMCLIATEFCDGHICTCELCILVTSQTCHIDVLVGVFFFSSEFYLVLFDNFWLLDTSRKLLISCLHLQTKSNLMGVTH